MSRSISCCSLWGESRPRDSQSLMLLLGWRCLEQRHARELQRLQARHGRHDAPHHRAAEPQAAQAQVAQRPQPIVTEAGEPGAALRQQKFQVGLAEVRTGQCQLAQDASPAGVVQDGQCEQPDLRMRQPSLLTHGTVYSGQSIAMASCMEGHSRDELTGLQVPPSLRHTVGGHCTRCINVVSQIMQSPSLRLAPEISRFYTLLGRVLLRACRQYHRLTVSSSGMHCSAPQIAASLTLRLLSPLSDSSVRHVSAAIAASAASLSLLPRRASQ